MKVRVRMRVTARNSKEKFIDDDSDGQTLIVKRALQVDLAGATTHSHSLSPTHSHTHTHAHTLTCSHSHSHSLTHTYLQVDFADAAAQRDALQTREEHHDHH